jgi:hypothetical protein
MGHANGSVLLLLDNFLGYSINTLRYSLERHSLAVNSSHVDDCRLSAVPQAF